ncbi:hypothetical protein GIB67_036913 [Kingdonia uniflora]|uniref:Uncharacterized protein n=1 Tax=Kingdonia uniflora TaxID=39325 RepID=A0A7J7NVL5_9MAGN|nr:hypothetical protein GIB67_036913 [Kingdonia uniflora]
MQWDPNRNMKDALKREVIIAGNINRKRVLLQSPFDGYEWYLGDRCWAQLEHRAMPRDPLEKLHYFPSPDVGVEVDWEDHEGEAGTSQAGTSRGRGSRGSTSQGGAAPPRRSRHTRGSLE